jgi:dihydrofolate reductase
MITICVKYGAIATVVNEIFALKRFYNSLHLTLFCFNGYLTTMQLRIIIAALSQNHVIGFQNSLPWNLPDDWKRFKTRTENKPFIMGRLSFESPHALISTHKNIVLSRNIRYALPDNCTWADSLADAFQQLADEPEVYILGGGMIFQEALALCNRMYLTHVHANFEGDTFFPEFDPQQWKITSREDHPADTHHAYDFSFVDYEKVC